jgi:3-oxoacyl-[acyl-carrier protein] reductase
MTKRLDGRAALLFGAAKGIGEGIAERFIEEGARVLIADADGAAAEATARRLGGRDRCLSFPASVVEPAEVDAAVTAAQSAFGRVDILVQNAGIYPWHLIEDISVEEWDRVCAVNLRGTFLAAKACLAPMRAQGYGRMVFTSSITGPRVTSPGHGHYAATKAGINGFIRSAAIEFAGFGITVNGVEPGNILTEGMKRNRSPAFIRSMQDMVPLGRLGTPRDVANAVLFLASDEAEYVTGTTIIVDGGQILPEGADFRITP